MSAPKILLFDIETMANKAYVWGKYEQNVLSFDTHWYMLCFAYKWLDQKIPHIYALPDFKGYKRDKLNDKKLCIKLWELFNQADIIIGHNSDSFDIKRANARFAYHKLKPPKPYKSVDTLKIARKYFKFESNKLDDLGDHFNLGRKVTHTGWDLWLGCAVRDEKKSWDKMKEYNKQDIRLLEKVYLELRPWMDNHPNHNLYADLINVCPVCGGKLIRRGYRYTRVAKRQQFKCSKCGAWCSKPVYSIVR